MEWKHNVHVHDDLYLKRNVPCNKNVKQALCIVCSIAVIEHIISPLVCLCVFTTPHIGIEHPLKVQKLCAVARAIKMHAVGSRIYYCQALCKI